MKVVNILKDGTVLDSMEGVVIPRGHPAERAIRQAAERIAREKEKERGNYDWRQELPCQAG